MAVVQTGWARLIPFLGFHHVLMILLATAIIFLSILLAGCTSTSLNNVYLLSLSYINASTPVKIDPVQISPNISNTFSAIAGHGNNTVVEVRTGYMGICIRQSIGLWVCSNSILALANLVRQEDSGSGASDPLNLIWIAKNFKNQIIFDGLIYTAIPLTLIAILFLASFPGWHEGEEDGSEREVKPFPSRPVSQAVLFILVIACVLTFVSILWQHVSSSAAGTMVHSLAYGTVHGHVGTVAMVLGWGGVLLLFCATVAILIMILSIRILSERFM